MFYEVLVPLMEVESTATICISTPLGKNNFYSELAEARDDRGKLIFNVFRVDGSAPTPWKTASSRSRIRALYGERSTLYKREILGEIADDDENAAFNYSKLEKMFDRPPLTPQYEIADNYVYIALDPNGGGTSSGGPGSDTAIVSFFVSRGTVVIVGLESVPTTGWQETSRLLYAHMKALKEQRCFADCRFMLILEGNLGNEAQICAHEILKQDSRADVLCQTDYSYGVFTDPGDPERYAAVMQDRLQVEGVAFHRDWVTVARKNQQLSKEALRANVLREFRRQMVSFKAIHVVPKALFGRIRIKYTGKADRDGKRSSRLKDDLCMAFIIGLFYATKAANMPHLYMVRGMTNAFEYCPETGQQLRERAFTSAADKHQQKRRRIISVDEFQGAVTQMDVDE